MPAGLAGGIPGNVNLWKMPGGQLLHTLDGHRTHRVNDVAFSKDGRVATASYDKTVSIDDWR